MERYNHNKVIRKHFQQDDLMWKMIIPIDKKDYFLEKWSPNQEGPFVIKKVFSENDYQLADLNGHSQQLGINKKYLKKYTLTMWKCIKNVFEEGFQSCGYKCRHHKESKPRVSSFRLSWRTVSLTSIKTMFALNEINCREYSSYLHCSYSICE